MNINSEKSRLQEINDRFKERAENLNQEIEKRLEERKKTFDNQISASRQENEHLRLELKAAENKISTFETLQTLYGEDPAILRQKFVDLQKSYQELFEEFSKRPSSEILSQYENLKTDYENLQNLFEQQSSQLGNLQRQTLELEKLRNQNTILVESNESLRTQWNDAKDLIHHYEKQLKRLSEKK